jgi:2-polyprenyl-3-methyl-5-hydroxy-6-metoxy-1,4-benzoquinol methylase
MSSLLKRKVGSCCYSQPAPCADQRCPLCGGEKISVFSSAQGGTLDAGALGSSRTHVAHGRILQCCACDFVFSELRPADEDLHTLYRDMDPGVYEQEADNRKKTAERHLRIVETYAAKGKVIDVGCASGAFLNAAADAGWQVTGVEPASVLCAKAKALLSGRGEVFCATLKQAMLQQAALPKESFDALTLWDVLEHVTEPVSFLRDCAALLKSGGHLFVNVPDVRSWPARLLGERWPLFLAEHLNYFDRGTLNNCANQAGLQWVAYGRRPASFSLEYIFYRLAQHGIPGSGLAHRLVRASFLRSISLPVPLGETWGVWRRS